MFARAKSLLGPNVGKSQILARAKYLLMPNLIFLKLCRPWHKKTKQMQKNTRVNLSKRLVLKAGSNSKLEVSKIYIFLN